MTATLAERIDALLPQTQCTRCGYPDCRAYADALAADQTKLNRCPPGGIETIDALAILLQCPLLPLDPACGEAEHKPIVAYVREPECIGCYKCADACPVDAFVGAPKLMHTVIEAECTGCELCLPVCPVDCIELRARQVDTRLARERAAHSRRRYRARQQRLTRRENEREAARLHKLTTQAREARISRYLDAARRRINGDKT